tara:strand:- start:7941 stop:8894 length:954 start_codon:yes stop_codon:yes gene_type:complete
MNKQTTIDFIIPVFNEEDSIKELFERISSQMKDIGETNFKVFFINDGSTDLSWSRIKDLADIHQDNCRGINLRRNMGKAFALNIGFTESEAPIVFTMDADLQDDPAEIPNFLKKIREGFDLVSGWKSIRNDPIDKTLPSKVFNKMITVMTGLELHDFNCGFKCYRKEVSKSLELYGELHRFTPVLADYYGFKIAEISIKHHARKHGKSKYGFERFMRGFIDLISVVSFTKYSDRPAHLFGGIGILSGVFGFTILGYLFLLKVLTGAMIGNRPLLTLGVLLSILSIQLISLGIIAELITRRARIKVVDQTFISEVTGE